MTNDAITKTVLRSESVADTAKMITEEDAKQATASSAPFQLIPPDKIVFHCGVHPIIFSISLPCSMVAPRRLPNHTVSRA